MELAAKSLCPRERKKIFVQGNEWANSLSWGAVRAASTTQNPGGHPLETEHIRWRQIVKTRYFEGKY